MIIKNKAQLKRIERSKQAIKNRGVKVTVSYKETLKNKDLDEWVDEDEGDTDV